MVVEQAGQQVAVAANMSAAQNLDQVLRSELERKVETDNTSKVQESEQILKKALDGKGSNVGTEIVTGLLSKLAKTIKGPKLLGELEQEFKFLNDTGGEDTTDTVSLQSVIKRIGRNAKGKGNQSGYSGGEGGQEQRGAEIKEYVSAYSSLLVNGGSETKKKLEQLEEGLLKGKGLSLKDLQSVKSQVANSVRSEIMRQMKDAYLKQVLANSKSIEWLVAKKEAQNILDYVFFNDNLGGYDFGGREGNLQGATNAVQGQVHGEMRDFVEDALSENFMKVAMGKSGKETEEEITQLLKLGEKVGFNMNKFLHKLPRMNEDLGLSLNLMLETAPNADAGGSNGQQRQQHQYQYTTQDEKDVLIDKLRALYMRRAVHGDMRTVLETQFKMIKTRNGLIKLGVKNFDEIETEGRALARVKLFEMLREAFEERATYATLKGPAWEMTERKIKTVLKNLEKLGITLDQTELAQIRDKANQKMYREAEHEFALIKTAIEAQGEIAYLTNKRKTVSGILERLAEESNFQAPGHEIELSVREAC